jgi:hypothetical protein
MVKVFKNTIKTNETDTQSKKLHSQITIFVFPYPRKEGEKAHTPYKKFTRVSLEDDDECMHTVAN